MALVMNTLVKKKSTKVHGKHFTFQAGQIKHMSDEFGDFITQERAYEGFVGLDSRFDDPEFKGSEEGKQLLQEAVERGRTNRQQELDRIIYNEQVSLQQDLDIANIKLDATKFSARGSNALVNALEEKLTYQELGQDADKKRTDRIEELEKKLKELE